MPRKKCQKSNRVLWECWPTKTVTGTVTETARLEANGSVSLHGNIGVVGNSVFRDLDSATGSVAASAFLVSSDGGVGDTVLSHETAIGFRADSAYVFSGLESRNGNIGESIKILASDGMPGFGASSAFDEDRFVIGAVDGSNGDGKAYTGTISSMTTLDEGNASRAIFGLSFESRTDWIVGENTSDNHVLLGDGDSAEVLAADMAVFIGKNTGSNDNSLRIAGSIEANEVFVGAEGNSGNHLILESSAINLIDEITLFYGNKLCFEGEFTTFSDLDAQLGSTDLIYGEGSNTSLITANNFDDFLLASFDSSTGYSIFLAVPEPASGSLLLLTLAGFAAWRGKVS